MKQLTHITINTGDIAIVPREHLHPQIAQLMGRLIGQMDQNAGKADQIEGLPGWRLSAGLGHGCVSVLMEKNTQQNGWCGVALFGVCTDSQSGKSFWESLHDPDMQTSAITNQEQSPRIPWMATRVLPAAEAATPQEMAKIADLSECFALAWIDLLEH